MLNIKIFLITYLTIVTVNINIIATVAIVLLDLYFNATTSSKIIHFVLIITIPILTYISNFFQILSIFANQIDFENYNL